MTADVFRTRHSRLEIDAQEEARGRARLMAAGPENGAVLLRSYQWTPANLYWARSLLARDPWDAETTEKETMIPDPNNQDRNEKVLAVAIESFNRNWQPRDRRYQREFEVELYQLIQYAFRVVQQLLIKQMSAAMSLIPMPPIIIEKKL